MIDTENNQPTNFIFWNSRLIFSVTINSHRDNTCIRNRQVRQNVKYNSLLGSSGFQEIAYLIETKNMQMQFISTEV